MGMLRHHGAATHRGSGWVSILMAFLVSLLCLLQDATCLSEAVLRSLQSDTINVFYHGYDQYMVHAFPEDELKPVSCMPLIRDHANPANIEVNDVLGNYSLTLIDSLSTLAIIASSDKLDELGRNPLQDFQKSIKEFVALYGDGSNGTRGVGSRSRGFDLDSKVQVFETVIRGVGGLLSAHLFAIGELPINRYKPKINGTGDWLGQKDRTLSIEWGDGFEYNGQLLRLAYDLSNRILPAFETPTGLPYPRVNLRHGAAFYEHVYEDPEDLSMPDNKTEPAAREITETCSAGAGSLVLEFTTLSRLTGDKRFERAAKRAFRAVWDHRSAIDLVGAGIDAETGHWVGAITGIGAGIDSFFEYAFKSYVLLSASQDDLEEENDENQNLDFLSIWEQAHMGIKRHLYRGSAYQHPHYIQGDINTGAARAFWIDSLSAYYPGILTLAGELDEAIEAHLLYSALWTRYSALPERWSAVTGSIDNGLRWWGGRPEFIESTWYLYHATKDPWYIYVGQMALLDIKRRCWTPCGWAGLEDVRTGQLKDRMESFFLGETVKYLYLLFDENHPLNKLDSPIIFTTEGHPLRLPKSSGMIQNSASVNENHTCPIPPPLVPLSVSATTSRRDFYHAASLARLHRVSGYHSIANETVESAYNNKFINKSTSSTTWNPLVNGSFYPWNLPKGFLPQNGFSDKLGTSLMFDLSFPTLPDSVVGVFGLKRVDGGIIVNSVSGLKFSMVQEAALLDDVGLVEAFRVLSVSHMTLGRDEKVFLPLEAASKLNPADPYFTRYRDLIYIDLIVETEENIQSTITNNLTNGKTENKIDTPAGADAFTGSLLGALFQHVSSVMEHGQQPLSALLAGSHKDEDYTTIPSNRAVYDAVIATGAGAGTLPDVPDASWSSEEQLPWRTVFVDDYACGKLPDYAPKENQVIVVRRGKCSFQEKLQSIPAYTPLASALRLVIVVSDELVTETNGLTRPLIDQMQLTPSGSRRFNPIPLVLVGGGNGTLEMLRKARGLGLRRRYRYESQGLRISNLLVV